MDKKHQVFVSSTYEDLQVERQEVMHVLLELDCIPSGMELFPAAHDSQWELIKGVIDDCDYYVVIIAGRYGSIGPSGSGISYTEMEYRYAVEKGKPVVAFLHGDPDSIPSKWTEKSEDGKEKLQAFRDLVQKRVCKEWKTSDGLGSVVSRSLVTLRKRHPAVGWIRADQSARNNDSLKYWNYVRKSRSWKTRCARRAPKRLRVRTSWLKEMSGLRSSVDRNMGKVCTTPAY